MAMTSAQRSEVSKRAWKKRKPKAIDAYTGKPIFAGGVIYKGKPYHKTSLAAMKAGIPAKMISNPENVLRKRREPFRGRRLPRRSTVVPGAREFNPQYAFGPTGYRPPAAWWAKMMAQAKMGYRRIKGQSLESYNRALSRIVGGIWSKYTDATRMKILRKYEPSVVRAKANVPRLRNLPCPVCGVTNPVGSANVYLRCKGCGRPLMSVRVRHR